MGIGAWAGARDVARRSAKRDETRRGFEVKQD
jgi:hypothetical protein